MSAKIRVLKGSRSVEFPEYMSKSELVSIILKWAPKIANDSDTTAYTVSGNMPSECGLSDVDDLLKDLID